MKQDKSSSEDQRFTGDTGESEYNLDVQESSLLNPLNLDVQESSLLNPLNLEVQESCVLDLNQQLPGDPLLNVLQNTIDSPAQDLPTYYFAENKEKTKQSSANMEINFSNVKNLTKLVSEKL